MNVEVGSQRRLERPVVGQLHLGEDGGVHAVQDLLWSAEGDGCTSLRHVSAYGGSSVKGAGMLGQQGVKVQRNCHGVGPGWYQMTAWQQQRPGIIALVDPQRPFISSWWLGGFPIPARLPEATSRCDGLVVRRKSFRLRTAHAESDRHACVRPRGV